MMGTDDCVLVVRGPCKRKCKPCNHMVDVFRRTSNSRINVIRMSDDDGDDGDDHVLDLI